MSLYETTLRERFPDYFRSAFELLKDEGAAALVAQQLCLEHYRAESLSDQSYSSS